MGAGLSGALWFGWVCLVVISEARPRRISKCAVEMSEQASGSRQEEDDLKLSMGSKTILW